MAFAPSFISMPRLLFHPQIYKFECLIEQRKDRQVLFLVYLNQRLSNLILRLSLLVLKAPLSPTLFVEGVIFLKIQMIGQKVKLHFITCLLREIVEYRKHLLLFRGSRLCLLILFLNLVTLLINWWWLHLLDSSYLSALPQEIVFEYVHFLFSVLIGVGWTQ